MCMSLGLLFLPHLGESTVILLKYATVVALPAHFQLSFKYGFLQIVQELDKNTWSEGKGTSCYTAGVPARRRIWATCTHCLWFDLMNSPSIPISHPKQMTWDGNRMQRMHTHNSTPRNSTYPENV